MFIFVYKRFLTVIKRLYLMTNSQLIHSQLGILTVYE
jgi:hypothetical protein